MLDTTFLHKIEEAHTKDPQDLLKTFRAKSWEALHTPLKEPLRYLGLKNLYNSSFESPQEKQIDKAQILDTILPQCQLSHIVFVDGHFSSALSDLSALPIMPLPLKEALQKRSAFLQGHFTKICKEETDPFAWLNIALHKAGVFLYLPPNTSSPVPLQCIHLITEDKPALLCPRLHLVLGSASQLDCITTTHVLNQTASHLALPTIDLVLEEGSCLHLFQMSRQLSTWHFESVRALLKKQAQLHVVAMQGSSHVTRQTYKAQLQGENSEITLNGLGILNQRKIMHVQAEVEHQAPHTRSLQRFKTILRDHSQSHFEGNIVVRPAAQKTEAYQINHHLLLNQGVIARTKPSLKIFADDVKASHGATIASIDEKQLLYLKMRGITSTKAADLLTHAFCREIIEKIPYPNLR